MLSSFLLPPDDLTRLKLIDADALRALAARLNADATPSPRVVVLATGGTLAMKTENGLRRTALNFDALLNTADPSLNDRATFFGLDAFNLDSSQMDYRHTRETAIALTWLWNNINVPILGFLITHGTDTMAFAGAALSLMLGQGLPFSVVYTGAQRPLAEPQSDAPATLVAQQAALPDVKAMILYTYGAGTLHEDILDALTPVARTRKIPVFIVNPVHADYRANYPSSQKALALGLIPLNMTLAAALPKIELALTLFPADAEALKTFMTQNHIGEIPTLSRRATEG